MIKKKGHRKIQELGINPRTVQKVGEHAYVGMSGSTAYAWAGSLISEFPVGAYANVQTVSAANLASFRKLNHAGRNSFGRDVFMSMSCTESHVLPTAGGRFAITDEQVASQAAMAEALNLNSLFESIQETLTDLSAQDADDLDKEVAATMQITSGPVSTSTALPVFTYDGPDELITDANDEYDLELVDGSQILFRYVDRDVYQIVYHGDPNKIKFLIRGHRRAFDLLSNCSVNTTRPGIVSRDRERTFTPVGVMSRTFLGNVDVREGTAIYSCDGELYAAPHLRVSLSSVGGGADDTDIIAACLADDRLPSLVKGRMVRNTATPKNSADTALITKDGKRKQVKVPNKGESVIAGFFSLNENRPDRARIVFGANAEEVSTRIQELLTARKINVDYYLAEAKTNDPIYLEYAANPSSVIVRALNTFLLAYPNSRPVKFRAHERSEIIQVEPKAGAPAPTHPFLLTDPESMYKSLYALLSEGYFNTGARQGKFRDNGLAFVAASVSDAFYDQVAGIARRIKQYLEVNGVPIDRMGLQRGERTVMIRIKLRPLTKVEADSVHKAEELEAPVLDATLYTTRDIKMGGVSIKKYNQHTGMCTVQEQHGDNYRQGIFDTPYTNLKRVL